MGTYNECTAMDSQNYNALWCSKTQMYQGHFGRCEMKCDNNINVGAVVGGTIGGAVAIAGAGLIAWGAATASQQATGRLMKQVAAPTVGILNRTGIDGPDVQLPQIANGASLMYEADALKRVHADLAGAGALGNTPSFFI